MSGAELGLGDAGGAQVDGVVAGGEGVGVEVGVAGHVEGSLAAVDGEYRVGCGEDPGLLAVFGGRDPGEEVLGQLGVVVEEAQRIGELAAVQPGQDEGQVSSCEGGCVEEGLGPARPSGRLRCPAVRDGRRCRAPRLGRWRCSSSGSPGGVTSGAARRLALAGCHWSGPTARIVQGGPASKR
jgi:hypothetical protein